MGLIIGNLVDDDLTPDPADLAKLRAVSKAMRDEVDVTGRTLEELTAKYAAGLECLRAVVRLQKRGLLPGRESHYLCQAAAASGQLEELKVLRGLGVPWNVATCWGAACYGHLHVVRWAHTNGCPWDHQTCLTAARGGHLEVLQWGWANGCPWDAADMCGVAAQFGRLEVMKWAHANSCPLDKNTWADVTIGGHLDMLQ